MGSVDITLYMQRRKSNVGCLAGLVWLFGYNSIVLETISKVVALCLASELGVFFIWCLGWLEKRERYKNKKILITEMN